MSEVFSLSLLVITSEITERNHLEKALMQSHMDVQVTNVSSLKDALKKMETESFDLLALDLFLSDSRGIKTLVAIQNASDSPILLIGNLPEDLAQKAIRLGAQDYLPEREFSPHLISRVIHYAIERNQLSDALRALSYTDDLTGLYNRRGFFALLEQRITASAKTKKGFHLLTVDLDFLKHINDRFGHRAGDMALKAAADCSRMTFRRHDVLGRIGGDEFAILALNRTAGHAEFLKQRLLATLKAFNEEKPFPFVLSISIGTAFYEGKKKQTIEELFAIADEDLYREKKIFHEKHI